MVMRSTARVAPLTLLILAACVASSAQIQREVLAYTVTAKPVISIRNQYGRITVTPSSGDRVVATVVHSNAVQIQSQQAGNRVELTTGSQIASGAMADNVDYQVLVPADACVILSTAAGSLSAENLEGDLIFEGTTASVDAHLIHNAHIHVRTLSGPISLRQVKDGRVDVTTSSGDVLLQDVSGPNIEVHSGTGRIRYTGNPGLGFYKLVTGSGNIDVAVISPGFTHFKVHSVRGKVDNQILPQRPIVASSFSSAPANALLRPASAAFELHSFRGNILVHETSK
jgi:Putative adhesin